MSFPPSVEHFPLLQRRRGNPKPRRRLLPGEDDLPSPDEPPATVGVGGPVLDWGRDGAVRLERVGNGWGWRWLGEDNEGARLVLDDQVQMLFPATRKVDEKAVEPTLRDRTRSAHEYLRTLGDVHDILGVGELVSAELSEVHAATRRKRYDPFRGPTLVVVHNGKSKMAKTVVLFPMGEFGNHLNVSPFITRYQSHAEKAFDRFVPTAKAVESFPTEILQICSSPFISTNRLNREATTVLVRLHSSVHLMHLIPDHMYFPGPDAKPANIERVAVLSPSDTESRRHMDVVLDPSSWSRALIVDEGGGVWLWHEVTVEVMGRQHTEMRLEQLRPATSFEGDQFFRIAFGARPGTAVVMSATAVTIIDIEALEHIATTALTLSGHGRYFTALEKTSLLRAAPLTCLCTTHEIIWIDEFRAVSPVLSWRHDYGSGKHRDLEIAVMNVTGNDYTFLSSRSNSLVMALCISSSSPFCSQHHPRAITVPVPASFKPLFDLTAFTIGSRKRTKSNNRLLFRSPNGSVHTVRVRTLAQVSRELDYVAFRGYQKDKAKVERVLKVDWDDEVEQIAEEGWEEGWSDIDDDAAEKGKAKSKQMNARWAWLKINEPIVAKAGAPVFTAAELTGYMRELDAPLEHLVTAGDLARDAVLSTMPDARAPLLKALPIDTTDSKLLEHLEQVDMARYLSVITQLGVSDGLPNLNETLSDPHGNAPGVSVHDQLAMAFPSRNTLDDNSRHREGASLQQLALDLMLSSTVLFSEQLSVKSQNAINIGHSQRDVSPEALMARVSLGEREVPPVTFSFLAARNNISIHGDLENDSQGVDDIQSESVAAVQSETVRILVSEWSLGSDPRAYRWKSWRSADSSTPPLQLSQRSIRPLPSPRQSQSGFALQSTITSRRPISSTQLPAITTSAILPAYSVPSLEPDGHSLRGQPAIPRPVSPPRFAVTQIERGAFGGRLDPISRAVEQDKVRKKTKKRVGGF